MSRPDISTSTYPTHQAIGTYEKNRKTGDWGLKRNLPLRTTLKSSTPAVRVRQMDSTEMITDFASAGEHTITVQKFQELNMPITIPELTNTFRGQGARGVSVFEEDADFTTKEGAQGELDESKRWKFSGPWLAGMTDGDFHAYLRRTVRPRRAEFREFLKKRMAADMTASKQQAALENAEVAAVVRPEDITDAQFTENLRKLRAERIALFAMVGEFLDLAPVNPPSALASLSSGSLVQAKSTSPYAAGGPPNRHPSAGLSYLRTASVAENHPIYGPQAQPSPVTSRIITPRLGNRAAKIGVAGFVAEAPQGDSAWNIRATRTSAPNQSTKVPGLAYFDPEIPGGPKAYVKPRKANIAANGRVQITVDDAPEVAQLIAKELVGEAEIYNNKKSAPATFGRLPSGVTIERFAHKPKSNSQTYGLDA